MRPEVPPPNTWVVSTNRYAPPAALSGNDSRDLSPSPHALDAACLRAQKHNSDLESMALDSLDSWLLLDGKKIMVLLHSIMFRIYGLGLRASEDK